MPQGGRALCSTQNPSLSSRMSGPGLSRTKVPSGACWAQRFLGKQQGEGEKETENKKRDTKALVLAQKTKSFYGEGKKTQTN